VLGSYNALKATLPHLLRSAAKYRRTGTITNTTTTTTTTTTNTTTTNTTTNSTSTVGSTTGGRVIFVGTTIHFTGVPLQAHVAVAKAGVDALAAAVALEMGPRGMTANVVAPGAIAGTEGAARLVPGLAAHSNNNNNHNNDNAANNNDKALNKDATAAAALAARIPAGRWGTVRDVADATVWLFSAAGSYVNGATIVGKRSFFNFFLFNNF
jgi:peroxisomal 2,4-dienoyl-CoA reductase